MTTNRRIPLHEYTVPDPRLTAWLEANDVDPQDVIASSYALIVDEKVVAFVGFHRDAGGKKVVDGEGAATIVVKVPIVVPMKSAPEDHGL